MKKRVPIAIVVHLARAEDHTAAGPELTYTDNMIRSVHSSLRKPANQSDEDLERGSSETLNVARFLK